jgi:selenocysteine lyase/cysteine desulfurase
MTMDRRSALGTIGGLAALAVRGGSQSAFAMDTDDLPTTGSWTADFPRKEDFDLPAGRTYINCAYTHPMPKGAVASVRRHLDRRSKPDADLPAEPVVNLKAEFAALINAKPSEISYVTSTSAGENLVVNGLGIRKFDGNVVTDALHFDGALVHLNE